MKKTVLLAAALSCFALSARAADDAVLRAGAVTLQLPPAAVEYIGSVLRKQPYEQAAPLLNEMQKQIDAQRRPPNVTELDFNKGEKKDLLAPDMSDPRFKTKKDQAP